MDEQQEVVTPTSLREGRGTFIERFTEWASGVPVKFRGLFLRALAGELPPRQAIKAKCQECVGWEEVKPRVGGCGVRRCPLWAYRPYQGSHEQE